MLTVHVCAGAFTRFAMSLDLIRNVIKHIASGAIRLITFASGMSRPAGQAIGSIKQSLQVHLPVTLDGLGLSAPRSMVTCKGHSVLLVCLTRVCSLCHQIHNHKSILLPDSQRACYQWRSAVLRPMQPVSGRPWGSRASSRAVSPMPGKLPTQLQFPPQLLPLAMHRKLSTQLPPQLPPPPGATRWAPGECSLHACCFSLAL